MCEKIKNYRCAIQIKTYIRQFYILKSQLPKKLTIVVSEPIRKLLLQPSEGVALVVLYIIITYYVFCQYKTAIILVLYKFCRFLNCLRTDLTQWGPPSRWMVLFVAIHYLSNGLRTLPQSNCAKNILRYLEMASSYI